MQSHTHKSKQEMKKHGDAVKSTMKPAQTSAPRKDADPVPLPEHGAHAHSYAAHLGNPMRERTAPAGNFRQGAGGQLREPPQMISRIGKQHRGS